MDKSNRPKNIVVRSGETENPVVIESPWLVITGPDGTEISMSWDHYLGGFKIRFNKGTGGKFVSECAVRPEAANTVTLCAVR